MQTYNDDYNVRFVSAELPRMKPDVIFFTSKFYYNFVRFFKIKRVLSGMESVYER